MAYARYRKRKFYRRKSYRRKWVSGYPKGSKRCAKGYKHIPDSCVRISNRNARSIKRTRGCSHCSGHSTAPTEATQGRLGNMFSKMSTHMEHEELKHDLKRSISPSLKQPLAPKKSRFSLSALEHDAFAAAEGFATGGPMGALGGLAQSVFMSPG